MRGATRLTNCEGFWLCFCYEIREHCRVFAVFKIIFAFHFAQNTILFQPFENVPGLFCGGLADASDTIRIDGKTGENILFQFIKSETRRLITSKQMFTLAFLGFVISVNILHRQKNFLDYRRGIVPLWNIYIFFQNAFILTLYCCPGEEKIL